MPVLKMDSPKFKVEEDVINTCRGYVKRKLVLPEKELRYYEAERDEIFRLVKRTVELGESNSALIIGRRGSGKTTLLRNVLDELKQQKSFSDDAVIVELNGLIHTDDRLALKDATRQLQLENVVGDKVFGSFAENLSFLLQCLKAGNRNTSKSIIFILDEFDLFCAHHHQTLLYNLFDIAQSSQAPICVLGLTSRIDVTELLEKRVKSRFSHRQIFLFPGNHLNSDALRLEAHLELLKEMLYISPEQTEELDDVFCMCWNEHVESLIEDAEVRGVVKRMVMVDNTERMFKRFLFAVVSRLTPEHQFLTAEDFKKVHELQQSDAKVAMLVGLSVLELSLVIAMMHQTEIYEWEPFNFEMVYRRYLGFQNRNSTVQMVERPVVMKAFEHLCSLELITPVSSANPSGIQADYQLHNLLLLKEQVLSAVKQYSGLPTEVAQWATSSYQ